MTFHPDGRTLFCGLDDSLKVYSWEPVICHDTVDLGWSTLADLCIRDGKLLGCSYYQNSVGIWISDIALIEPYEASSVPKTRHDLLKESRLTRVASHGSSQSLRCISPDDDTKEIKNIYVDTSGEKPSNLRRSMSSNSLKAVKPSDSKEINNKSATHKRSPSINLHAKAIGQSLNKSFMGPNVVSRDSHQSKDLAKSRRESITKGNTGISLNPAHHVRRSTATTKLDVEKLSRTVDSLSFDYLKSDLSSPNVGDSRESSKGKLSNVTSVADKLAKVSPPSSQDNCVESVDSSKGMKSVKYVNGVAVVEGRTRSLVERFEKREKLNIDEAQKPDTTPHIIQEPDKASSPIPVKDIHTQVVEKESTARNEDEVTEDLMQNHDLILTTLRSRLTKLQVVRLFWERNDIKGGINAMQTLPDHSVQADVVSVLVEKMDIFTLDLFSCLLPVLFRLLDSKIDRHINVSLELLLKLVAVFGPSIRSTVSAPPSIGVDLHAEQRRECCNKCFILLEDVQKMLPTLVRRGGIVAKCALELNLVLQQS